MRLLEGENAIHELRPEPKILIIWFFTKCLPVAFVTAISLFALYGIFAGIFAASRLDLSDRFYILSFIGVPGLLLVLALIASGFYYKYLRRTYIYYITDRRCIFQGGILRRVQRSIPYHKITDVEVSQNIIERMLAISRLRIFTPGTASMVVSPYGGGSQRAEIEFVGLADSETPAETINGMLRKFQATGE